MHVKTKISSSLAVVFGILGITLLNQNCGPQVHFNDLEAASRAAEAERLAIGLADETVVVGSNGVPHLKMFFVVDNSGTMVANQLNLSDSFGSLFDKTSTNSLSKFDTTVSLISTAQKSPSFTSERTMLDGIVARQKAFMPSLSLAESIFTTTMRTTTTNSGQLPGDNIGYQVLSKLNPLTYTFLPAPVLGATNTNGNISFNPVIRKLASESSSALETDFKARLKILDSNRIPASLINNQYIQENSSILDTESGLCAVARILRNPDVLINSGDLLSFTVVSDENDNDPKGLNCVQSIQEFKGTEDLIDGECRQRTTKISYQTSTISKLPDSCKIDSLQGYNYRLGYSVNDITTRVVYKNITAWAVYQNPVTDLTYSAQTKNYQSLNTNVSYYIENCYDKAADGGVIGSKICTVSSLLTGSLAGDKTSNCFAAAQALDPKAINRAGYVPVCSTQYKSSGPCDETSSTCKVTVSSANKTVPAILGSLDASACLAKAKTFTDYTPNTTPTCTSYAANCSPSSSNPSCIQVKPITYGTNTIAVAGDKTADGCLALAQGQYLNAVTTTSDISSCTKVSTPRTATYDGSISFTDSADGGTLISNSTDCGVIKTNAINKAMKANGEVPASSSCVVTGYYNAGQISQAVTADGCTKQAAAVCTANTSVRSCSGQLSVGAPQQTPNPVVAFKDVQEDLTCASKCSDSKFGVCEDQAASALSIGDYLKNKFGATTTCSTMKSEITAGAELKTMQFANNQSNICSATLQGVPRYFVPTTGIYQTYGLQVDYVAGTVKDSKGVNQPKQGLVDYIQSRSKELSNGSALFSALVRRPGDSLGNGGSLGTDYESLISQTGGQAGSVLSNDYSVVLKDLSRVIKNSIERTMVLKSMRPDQIITKVYRIAKGTTTPQVIDKAVWTQNGNTIIIASTFDITDGDQFKVEFQNYIKK